jgi:leucyl/phenylalanyl-tRNA--protein transferase
MGAECRWAFPHAETADEWGLVAVGADLEPGTLVAAYRRGLFPMPLAPGGPVGWWSPDPRGVLEPAAIHVGRSLRRAAQRFEIRVDAAFREVVAGCADPSRPHGWIDERIAAAYGRLHERGVAHSVEAWDAEGLAGGLYGVSLGGLFAAESKFHRRRDASKVALVALAAMLRDVPAALIDVQWATPHLVRLGARELPRRAYLERLERALASPAPAAFARAR